MSKISDILDKTLSLNIRGDYPNGHHELALKDKDKAEQQLKQYLKEEMLKLVGEDEKTVKFWGGYESSDAITRNDFRIELRQAIDKWEG